MTCRQRRDLYLRVKRMSTPVTHAHKTRRRTHKSQARPPFDCVALLLQGGGALGAYQAGVYQALSEVHLDPDWIAGISIGAINSALIASSWGAKERMICNPRITTWFHLAEDRAILSANLDSHGEPDRT
jgi:predicted acylesterase/phospholipase RssA